MKNIYAVIAIFSINLSNAQYGQEGAILGAAEAAIRALELQQLNKIAEAQQSIVNYHGIIALATAEIVRIEQIKLQSETKLKPWVNNLNSVVRIGLSAQLLIELQQQILDITQNVPELIPFITESMIRIIADSLIIVKDFAVALKESSTNLLDNKARMDVINVSQDGLDHLIGKSVKLLGTMETLSRISLLENSTAQQITIDVQDAMQQTQIRINELIIN